jgi:iduronate 2-sulfatase
MKSAVCLIAIIGLLTAAGRADTAGPATAAQNQPNVLLICVDDLNDYVGCLAGHPDAQTPNIDALARRGVLFTNAFCQAPLCGPSRASVFTGLLPATTGIYGQVADENIAAIVATEQPVRFLPDVLEAHGYETIAVGKIFHKGDAARVFDHYGGRSDYGPKPRTRMKYDPRNFPDAIGSTQTDWGAYPATDEAMPDHRAAGFAVEQLRTPRDTPFLLAVGFVRPHVPWHVPAQWFDRFPAAALQLPPYLPDDFADIPDFARRMNELPAMPTTEWAIAAHEWPAMIQAYLACTAFVDHQIGRVLQALADGPHASDTIVILWSDHGYHMGEKNRFAKQALWRQACRVPLVIATPGLPAGRCSAAVGLIDIYPTILDLCGLPAEPSNEGVSLVPSLHDPSLDSERAIVTSYGQHNHALQIGSRRYYRYEDGSHELYDHARDPHEWTNLAAAPAGEQLFSRVDRLFPDAPRAPAPGITMPTNAYFLAKEKAANR